MHDGVLVTVMSLQSALQGKLSHYHRTLSMWGTPIAVQLRETELGMTTETEVNGFTVLRD